MAGETMPYFFSFAPGSDEIAGQQAAELNRMLQTYWSADMGRLTKVHILAVGDLDSNAFDAADNDLRAANFALAERRTIKVRDYLVGHGIPDALIEALVPKDLFATPERRRDFDQSMANGTRLRVIAVWKPEPARAYAKGEPVPTC